VESGVTRYRAAKDADRIFIDYGWLDSYRWAHAAGMIHMDDWRDVMLPQIARVRSRPNTITMIAEEPDALAGFIVAEPKNEPPLVFYCYVKEAYRKSGIARGLFKAAGVDPNEHFVYACKTAVVSELTRKMPRARFDPYAARFDEYRPRRYE
jgi:hypothetical protein